jgi:predicted permease
METLWRNLKYGIRILARSRGFAALAVITLALGIGANTAIFSVLQGVVLAPLPYRAPDRLVLVWLYNLSLKSPTSLSYLDFLDWRRDARSFQQIAAFTWQDYDLTNPGTPQHLGGREVSSGFFSTLGVPPTLGREFSPDEDQPGGAPVIVISNRLWRNRFSGDPARLGKSVTLNGVNYTLVGVLPPAFRFGSHSEEADVYTPLAQGDPAQRIDRAVHNISCVGRLGPGVSMGQAQAEMNTIQENLDRLYSSQERGLETELVPLKEQLIGNVRGTLLLLLGAVGIVLLIACANVANLLLARSAARTREFAIRSALGANGAQIVWQLLTESVLLSLAGGVLGLAVAKSGLKVVTVTLSGSLPRIENIGLNASVLFFTLGISIAVGILFGLWPALKSRIADPQVSLKEGGRGSTGSHHRAQSSVLVAQMALTIVLLVGAGLLFRTIRHLWEVNPGFDTQHIVAFKIGLSPSVTGTPESMRVAYQQAIERIRKLPGIQSADLTTLVPLSGDDNDLPFWVGSQQPASIAEAPRVLTYSTGPDYLRVMGIQLLQGRFFTPEDTTNSAPVVVIDSLLAHSYFPNSNPVGQTISFVHVGAYRIIGVVRHVRHWELGNSSSYTQRLTLLFTRSQISGFR